MPDYKQGEKYTTRCKTNDTLIYILVVQRIHYVKEWHENFPCYSKEQLNKREGEGIREIGKINKQIAGRTHKEWYEDNKEQALKRQKENYNNNKDKILLKRQKEIFFSRASKGHSL